MKRYVLFRNVEERNDDRMIGGGGIIVKGINLININNINNIFNVYILKFFKRKEMRVFIYNFLFCLILLYL